MTFQAQWSPWLSERRSGDVIVCRYLIICIRVCWFTLKEMKKSEDLSELLGLN